MQVEKKKICTGNLLSHQMFSPIIIKASYYPEGPEQDTAYVIRKPMKQIHTEWQLRALTLNRIVYSSSFILLVRNRRSGTICVMRKFMFRTEDTRFHGCDSESKYTKFETDYKQLCAT